ncbi:enoyl-CoA hydratase/isomerase family protein [Conexibacter sp. DBS9H8]|uniref:enoyl-CoA hydratase/isomerase family protein n=1 Tax=Conexibacter sp. DBS9H8 TaxID=2937801 RepID=UPI00200E877F|nr:enoyl-CoA hydratase/isomerase family protein [Conexibacter sp. DBS9H8]
MDSEVILQVEGGLATLTLDAPGRRNALTVAMAEAIIAACERVDGDPAVGAAVIFGAGGYFCAGADRALLTRAGEDPAAPDRYDQLGAVYQAFTRIGALRVPTVAAIVGGAVGAGLNLALATDLRVIAEDATLRSGFLPIGLHPGGGHSLLLSRAAGREAANALALFGAAMTGTEAAARGLAWRALPAAEVLEAATTLAAVPAADPALARATARSMATVTGPPALPWPAALELERSAQMWSLRRRALRAGGS